MVFKKIVFLFEAFWFVLATRFNHMINYKLYTHHFVHWCIRLGAIHKMCSWTTFGHHVFFCSKYATSANTHSKAGINSHHFKWRLSQIFFKFKSFVLDAILRKMILSILHFHQTDAGFAKYIKFRCLSIKKVNE